MPGADAPSADRARSILDELGRVRQRARGQRRQDPLWAGLVAAVSAVGGLTFWMADQIETPQSCAMVDGGMLCSMSTQAFSLGWIWLAAALIATVVPFWWRHRHGTWRPSTGATVALAVVAVVVLPTVFSLVGVVHPVVHPTATAAAIAALAARRRDWPFLVAACLTAAGVLHVEFRVDASALMHHNLGLTLSALAVAGVATVAAAVWHARDRSR